MLLYKTHHAFMGGQMTQNDLVAEPTVVQITLPNFVNKQLAWQHSMKESIKHWCTPLYLPVQKDCTAAIRPYIF